MSLFALAVAVRCLPWSHVFASDGVYYYDADVYMRLRRVIVYLHAFPATVVHDYFQGFPRGTGVIAPPTLEYLLAALLVPLRSWEGLVPALRTGIAWLPPLAGGLTVVVLHGFVRRWFGALAALCAGLALAIMPAHVDATVLGRFDNEMLEPLLLLLVMAAYARTYVDAASRRSWVTAGAASAAYLLFWRGALFPLAIVALDIVRRALAGIGSVAARHVTSGAAFLCAVPAGVLAVICGADLWGTRTAFVFNVPSLFHLALFGWGTVVAAVGARVLPPDERLDAKRAAALGGWLAVTILGLVVMGAQLRGGWSVLIGGDAWLDSIVQYERGSLRDWPVLLGLLGIAAPALLVALAWRGPAVAPRPLLVLWTAVMLLAAAARLRFAMYLALNVAILGGIAVAWAAERLPRRWATAAGIAAVLLLQAPTYGDLAAFFRYGPTFSIRGDVEDTLVWLRDHTPAAGDPTRPTRLPAYGVLAPWDWGGWIETIAERPSVATSFGREAFGMEELSSFLLAPDPGRAVDVLAPNRIRYVVLASPFRSLGTHARLLGAPPEAYVREIRGPRGALIYAPTAGALALPSVRLFFADGRAAEAGPLRFEPVEGFRLAFESAGSEPVPDIPWDVKRVKVFEVVEGARLAVRAAPGRAVTLTQPVETNQGRTFVHEVRKVCGDDGTVSFRVPYAPKTAPWVTGSTGPVTVVADADRVTVEVAASDVASARTLTVRLPAGITD